MAPNVIEHGHRSLALAAPRCPGCSGAAVQPWRHVGEFLLARCAGCDLVFVLPRPSEQQLAAYYDAYFRKASGAEATMRRNRQSVHAVGLERIARIVSSGPLVDVGAAWGDFLALAQDRGFDVFGVEVAPEPCARIAARGFSCHRGSLRSAPISPGSVDVVTLWDTLEHVEDLHETLLAGRAASCARVGFSRPRYRTAAFNPH